MVVIDPLSSCQFKGLNWVVTDTVRSVLDLLSFEKVATTEGNPAHLAK